MIATFKTTKPVELRDGDPVVVEERDGERVVRSVPRLDSGEEIEGSEAFIAAVREYTDRTRHGR